MARQLACRNPNRTCGFCRWSARVRADWDALVASHPEATLYHRGPWLEVLRRAFGVRPSVAIMECSDSTVAGFVCEGRKSAPAQPRLVAVFGFLSAAGEERFIARVVDGEDGGRDTGAVPP